MTFIEYRTQFKHKLKAQKATLKQFERNLLSDTDPPPSFKDFLTRCWQNNESFKEIIMGAFVWENTPEGHMYWSAVSRQNYMGDKETWIY